MALGYCIALARDFVSIDRGVRSGGWPKPQGVSIANKTFGIIGYGDIGSNLVKRLLACDARITVWDPAVKSIDLEGVEVKHWPDDVGHCDFIVLTCSLNASTHHILNESVFSIAKPGLRVVNVARGPLIDELALVKALKNGQVSSAALDVFECEPLPPDSELRQHGECIFGSHNSSNTYEAVASTTLKALQLLKELLDSRS